MRVRYGTMFVVAAVFLALRLEDSPAHGPGRSLDLDQGYCGDNAGQVERTMTASLGDAIAPVPFCYRLINREAFPVGVRLSVLQGETSTADVDVCLVPWNNPKSWNDGVFLLDGKGCQNPEWVLAPNESRDIQGLWFFNPAVRHPGWVRHGENDLLNMIRCVLLESQPLREDDVHGSGFHIKNGRAINMTRLEGSQKMAAITPETAFPEDPLVCDRLSPYLARQRDTMKAQADANDTKISRTEQNVVDPSFATQFFRWLRDKKWLD
ncbi:MAG: hypothetical protein HW380_1812 [Magnetococcales bacterium]|nr:hypothetical protein [Magnetococcales bacterium]